MILLAGCQVTKDFEAPPAPAQKEYTPVPMPAETVSAPGMGGSSQRFIPERDIPAQWWSLYQSEPLDRLVRMGVEQSPTLVAAQAAVRQAEETLRAQTGLRRFPQVNGQLEAARAREPSAETGFPIPVVGNLLIAQVNVSYAFDVVGGFKRELEGLQAQVDYERFQVEATYLTLTSNIVSAAIREAALRAQIDATHEVLDAQDKQLTVVQKQFEVGAVPRSTVLTQSTQVAQTRTTLPPLEKALAQNRHALAVLTGRAPGEAGAPEFTLASLQLPLELPVSLPSALVRQRPDIRASETLLHVASTQVGVATANLYPQINLTGSFGTESHTVAGLFKDNSIAWQLAGGLVQPIFNGGQLQARRRAAVAAYEQATANYQQTVLLAFQNVADALRALESDAVALKTFADAEALARDALDLTNQQYRLGAVSYLSLLDAQRQYQSTRIALVSAQATRYSDTAALFGALGGGWWNRGALAAGGGAEPTQTRH